jgi:thiol:disulfide interchange protein
MRNGTPAKLILVPIALYIAVMLVLAAFVVHPPVLGWIGLGLAAALALLVTALAVAFFSRMRANADRLHPRVESVHRILLVIDADIEAAELASAVSLRAICPLQLSGHLQAERSQRQQWTRRQPLQQAQVAARPRRPQRMA